MTHATRAPDRLAINVPTFPVVSLARRVEAAVNNHYGAIKVRDDGGVDGVTVDRVAIQTTMQVVGRPKVDTLVAGMRRHGLNRGLLVAPRFAIRLQRELDRLNHDEHIDVQLVVLDLNSE